MGLDTKAISLTALFTSMSVTLRLFKHLMLGPLQFVNIPLAISMIAGKLLGPLEGWTVGMAGFILTDILLGFGPWTPIDATLSAVIGASWGVGKGRSIPCSLLGVCAFASTFIYDVLSSMFFYMLFGQPPLRAFLIGLSGLFLPVYGGVLGVGLVTEVATTALVVGILRALKGLKI